MSEAETKTYDMMILLHSGLIEKAHGPKPMRFNYALSVKSDCNSLFLFCAETLKKRCVIEKQVEYDSHDEGCYYIVY